MSNAKTLSMNSWLVAIVGFGLVHLAPILTSSSLAADRAPSSSYLGEIRRNDSGQIIAVPQAPTAAAEATSKPSSPPASPSPPPPAQPAARIPAAIASKAAPAREAKPAAGAMLSPAAGASPKVIRVGPNQSVRYISVAASLAKDGDTIEIEPGDYMADVAVWKQSGLTIRGVGGARPRLIAAGANAEGKAIWVMRGGAITVENIEFSGARVPDKNGAGIRHEKGHLIVRNCRFIDNENGILTGAGDAELDIENSEFGNNGAGDGRSHNIYVGALRRLRVTGSYFHHAIVGHLLKSRAAENHILYNRLTDETGGRASYELEFPNGGIALVIGNIIEQSSQTENSGIIAYGKEGYKWPRNELYLINNTIANDRPQGGSFLSVAPGAQAVKGFNNLLVGSGSLDGSAGTSLISQAKSELKSALKGALDIQDSRPGTVAGEFQNNLNVDLDVFAQAVRFDYRLMPGTRLANKYVAPGMAGQFNLAPQREYQHPASSRALAGPPTLPGALQTLAKP